MFTIFEQTTNRPKVRRYLKLYDTGHYEKATRYSREFFNEKDFKELVRIHFKTVQMNQLFLPK